MESSQPLKNGNKILLTKQIKSKKKKKTQKVYKNNNPSLMLLD